MEFNPELNLNETMDQDFWKQFLQASPKKNEKENTPTTEKDPNLVSIAMQRAGILQSLPSAQPMLNLFQSQSEAAKKSPLKIARKRKVVKKL